MGLILVFDMDQTILDSSDPYLFNRPSGPDAYKGQLMKDKIKEALNWNVVNIMRRAADLRPSGKVSAICMLTNNSSTIMVSAVDEVLNEIIGSKGRYKTYSGNSSSDAMPEKTYFFDSIMMRQHKSRPQVYDPPKRLIDILNMMQYLGIKDDGINTLRDIYFFDDIGKHNLRAEFNFMADGKYDNHYIQITPPYSKHFSDQTRYDSILEALSELDGKPPKLPMLPAKPQQSTMGTFHSTPHPVEPPYLNLNKPPQESTVHKKNSKRPSILSAFSKGGRRVTKKNKKKTRN